MLLAVVGLVAAASLALTMIQIGSQADFLPLLAGLALALIPVAIVLPGILWLDRLEAEPVQQLLFTFGWGAIIAPAGALLVNSFSLTALAASGNSRNTTAIFVAPWVEEVLKGLAVLCVYLWRKSEFDGVVDGIVYGALVGLGFAFTENVLYLGKSLDAQGVDGLVNTFILRCVVGPFAHPLFTVAVGVGIGLTASSKIKWQRRIGPLAGLLIAVLVHAIWNGSALAGVNGFFGIYLLIQMPIFMAALWITRWARQRESRLIMEHLTVYVANGWFTDAEVEMLGSTARRRSARHWAAQVNGQTGRRAMRNFQHSATELAFARDRATRASLHETEAVIEATLLRQATAHRHGFRQAEG